MTTTTELFAARVEAVRNYNRAQKAHAATVRGSAEAEVTRAFLATVAAEAEAAVREHEDSLGNDEDAKRAAAIEVRKLARI